ncbi:MAG: hypothetical protein U0787_09980 [Polyangia bacterium]
MEETDAERRMHKSRRAELKAAKEQRARERAEREVLEEEMAQEQTEESATEQQGEAKKRSGRRIAEEEILIRSLEPYVTLRAIVRIICCAPVVLAGYQAAIQGGAALDLGLLKVDLRDHILGDICKAMDLLEQERIAQIRAEHRKAAEYLKLAPMFLSGLSSIKRAFMGK